MQVTDEIAKAFCDQVLNHGRVPLRGAIYPSGEKVDTNFRRVSSHSRIYIEFKNSSVPVRLCDVMEYKVENGCYRLSSQYQCVKDFLAKFNCSDGFVADRGHGDVSLHIPVSLAH